MMESGEEKAAVHETSVALSPNPGRSVLLLGGGDGTKTVVFKGLGKHTQD